MNSSPLAWPRRPIARGGYFLLASALLLQAHPARGQAAAPAPGEPLAGLSPSQTAAFQAGMVQFQTVETQDTGLGPIYNGNSCVECHSKPASGGSSGFSVTRFGQSANGVFDPLADLGGSLLQSHAIAPALQEVVPPEANVTAKRITTPAFGDGLIDAIPDWEIALNSLWPHMYGVHGRVAYVQDVVSGDYRVGRFGWKAQQATLLAFSGDAFNHEMGITNRLYPLQEAPNGNTALLSQYVSLTAPPKDEADPSTGKAGIDRLTDYMRYLAPSSPLPPTALSRLGAAEFTVVGCAACHVPEFFTGPNPDPVFSNKPVALYSDLLLHDMGSLGDGIEQGAATATEMRTAPLWGLHNRTEFLHDGRAATVDAAIRDHAGEAASVVKRYTAMPDPERQALLDFLQTL